MAEDAPAKAKHGGEREGAGRPPGSRNRPKNKATNADSSVHTHPVATASSTRPAKKSTKRNIVDTVLSAGRGIANFWHTRAPQGTHSMTAEGPTDLAPDPPISAADAITHLHLDMQTVAPSQLVNERVLDESVEDGGDDDVGAALLDDEADGGDEDNEGNLDTEQKNAEAAVDSVNDQWLATTLEKVQKEIDNHGQPRVYREGQLWIYPKDPIFALREAASTGVYSPDALYLLPIFLWLPDYLPGHPDRFHCECGEALNKHIAISHRSALDISQMDMMKITFAGRFGADPFSKMVRELNCTLRTSGCLKNPSVLLLQESHWLRWICTIHKIPEKHVHFVGIYIALSIGLEGDKICSIQLREKSSIYIFNVKALAVHIPLALKSVLTHPRIVKFGHEIASSAKHLSSAWGLSIPTSSLVDLGKLAKLKGAAADASCSLSTLCGAVLNLQLREPNSPTPPLPLASQLDDLAREVDCAWSIQQALMKLGSVGIPLQPSQLRPAQLVALVIGNKTQAWGELVEHDGYLVVPNTQGKVSVTQAYSVIKLTKVFVPGFIIAKHSQTLEWLNANGNHAVVQTRTLRSRAPEPPHLATESAHDPDLGTPAVVAIPSVAEQLAQGPPTHPDEVARAIDLQPDVESASHSRDEDTDEDITVRISLYKFHKRFSRIYCR
ncbi:hypothetical protein DFH09DRAFT_1289251 [Mycena vulgaris]|nr:hypothetical protein DFH09DRAFT_1289251 [Mycena vulgaris]